MSEELKAPKIFTAICGIIGDIGAVEKSKTSKEQGFKYRGIDDVMNALQPMLAKYHVFVVPTVLEQHREERQTKAGNASHLSIFKIKYTFYAEDGSFVEAVTVGESADTGDKGSNKAMAIAFKYALFQVFCIPTEEMPDPDSETPEPTKTAVKPAAAPPVAESIQAEAKPDTITSAQIKQLSALVRDSDGKVIQSQMDYFVEVCKEFGYSKVALIQQKDFQKIFDKVSGELPFDL
jgi:hypothetical protein